MMQKVAKRTALRDHLKKVIQFRAASDVDAVLSSQMKVDEKLAVIRPQLYIYRDLLQYGQKKVAMGFSDKVVQSNGKVKVKPWTGNKLLSFLCELLKTLLAGVILEFGVFKDWKQIVEAGHEPGCSTQYDAECFGSDLDDDLPRSSTVEKEERAAGLDGDGSDGDSDAELDDDPAVECPDEDALISEDTNLDLTFDQAVHDSLKMQWRRRRSSRREQFQERLLTWKSQWRCTRAENLQTLQRERQAYLEECAALGECVLSTL